MTRRILLYFLPLSFLFLTSVVLAESPRLVISLDGGPVGALSEVRDDLNMWTLDSSQTHLARDTVQAFVGQFVDYAQHQNPGGGIGVNIFWRLSSVVSAGLHVGYARWTLNSVDAREGLHYTSQDSVYFRGSTAITEILPSVRLSKGYEGRPITLFGQLGLGLYSTQSKAKVDGMLDGHPIDVRLDKTKSRLGISFGGGVDLGYSHGFRAEIMPVINLLDAFGKNMSATYYGINAGVAFEK